MAEKMVEVVIRIDKNTFDAAGMLQEFVDDGHIINGHHMKGSTFGNMIKAIAKGTILSEGHGDLKDVQDIINRINLNYNNQQSIDAYSLKDMIATTQTVIPADRGGKND